MPWYALELAAGREEDVDAVWRAAWLIAYTNKELNFRNAVFRKSAPDGAATVYFSPAAREMADAFGAKPCRPPSPAGMHLVTGDDRAWDVCFPEHRG